MSVCQVHLSRTSPPLVILQCQLLLLSNNLSCLAYFSMVYPVPYPYVVAHLSRSINRRDCQRVSSEHAFVTYLSVCWGDVL